MSIAEKLNNLSPSMRRYVMVGGVVGVILVVSWVIGSMADKRTSRTPSAGKPEVTVVSPTRSTGVEQFGAKMGAMEKNQDELARKIEKLTEAIDSRQGGKGRGDPLDDGKKAPADEIPSLTPSTSVFDAPASKAPELPPPPPTNAASSKGKTGVPNFSKTSTEEGTDEAKDEHKHAPSEQNKKQIKLTGESGELDQMQAEQKLNKPAGKKNVSKNDSAFIPAGSMFTGVLLNGIDAPTSAVAQKNPVPVVIRVKREAVLPNYASLDVRECFLLASGYGQLSSERAIMRAEALSCVRNDGKVIENKLEAYIVGTDGKVGIPGKLVSKQGQMIAQSLLAGTLGGLGQALNRARVPSLNINPAQDQSLYQGDTVSSIFQSGVAGGIGSATNMIAKFYLDMAKETFPVVEITAGEVGTVIVTRGSVLPLKGSTDLQKYAAPGEKRNDSATKPTDAEEPKNSAGLLDSATKAAEAAKNAVGGALNGGENANFSNGLGW